MNEDLPRLLRAIAGGENAKAARHDVTLNAAAAEIDRLRAGWTRVGETLRLAMDILECAETFKHKLTPQLERRIGVWNGTSFDLLPNVNDSFTTDA